MDDDRHAAFPELANIRTEYREVTLRDLLSHQSGFRRDTSPLAFMSGTTAQGQRALAVTWAVQQPPIVARGTFSYSNVGYVVAGAMLERAFGIEGAMAAHLHAPLGMTDAGRAAGRGWQHHPAGCHLWTRTRTSYGLGWLISTRSWANGTVLSTTAATGATTPSPCCPVRNVAFLATTNGFDAPGGRSTKALDALIGRLNTFHTTGQ